MESTPKRQVLRQTGTLNPRPNRVTDELFTGSDFFDPNDLLQVKYEMLRRVHSDDFTVRRAAQLFGFSRPSFYQAQETFTRGGLGALVPQKRGRAVLTSCRKRSWHLSSGPSPPIPKRTWSPPYSRSSACPYTDGASSGRWHEREKNDASDDRARRPCRSDRWLRAGHAL